jgi:hypothetical protein
MSPAAAPTPGPLPPPVDPEQDPVLASAQERINAAVERINELNRTLPPGQQPYQPVPWTDLSATLNALLRFLLEPAGPVGQLDFLRAKGEALANEWEALVNAAAEHKAQQMSGGDFVVAQSSDVASVAAAAAAAKRAGLN